VWAGGSSSRSSSSHLTLPPSRWCMMRVQAAPVRVHCLSCCRCAGRSPNFLKGRFARSDIARGRARRASLSRKRAVSASAYCLWGVHKVSKRVCRNVAAAAAAAQVTATVAARPLTYTARGPFLVEGQAETVTGELQASGAAAWVGVAPTQSGRCAYLLCTLFCCGVVECMADC
jgi:hypothetical protein